MHIINKRLFLIVICLTMCCLTGVGIVEYLMMSGEKIFTGVYVGNISLGGIKKQETEKLLAPLYHHAMERKIILKGGGKSWPYLVNQIGFEPDMEKTIHQAWLVGRQGPFWHRWYERWQITKTPRHIPLKYKINDQVLLKVVQSIAHMIEKEPENAGISIKPDYQVAIIPGVNGLKVNLSGSLEKIKNVIQSTDQVECSILEQVIHPRLSEHDVRSWEITGIVASYETNFNPAQKDRSDNIKIASQALNNYLVMPQQIFSFNQIVGPRTSEAGYKESLIIENNEFTPGIGGGVCQVSTTLYNTVLRANLPILERHAHSLPVSYVPPGMDATVAYNLADLKFLNDRLKPMLLYSEYRKGKVKVMIFGTVGEFPQVKVFSKVIQYLEPENEIITDPSLDPGHTVIEDKGHKGMVVEVIREITKDEKILSEVISRDKYKAQKAVIRVPAGN